MAPRKTKPKPEKRIPNGTTVFWQSYDYTPLLEGVVVSFDPAVKCYEVEVTKTPTGRLRKTPIIMRPWASRLEKQNHSKLRLVK